MWVRLYFLPLRNTYGLANFLLLLLLLPIQGLSHYRFTPGERVPGTHWIGGWVGPRSGRRGEEKILDSTGTRTPTSRSSSP
jgi:hypothetical protein